MEFICAVGYFPVYLIFVGGILRSLSRKVKNHPYFPELATNQLITTPEEVTFGKLLRFTIRKTKVNNKIIIMFRLLLTLLYSIFKNNSVLEFHNTAELRNNNKKVEHP